MTDVLPYDLTVVTVCRNAAAVLPRCIASVQPLYSGQVKTEHLLIDGASEDGTVELLQKELAAGRITRFISEPDAGLYDAMNKAIRLAEGKVIVFINADDEICSDAVPACVAPILNGEAEYAVAASLFIGDRKRYVLQPDLNRTMWRQPYCHQSMYCSTRLLRRVGGFRHAQFPIGADTEIMRRLYSMRIKCAVIPQIASHFYEGGISQSDAVLRERYELMLHFLDAYMAEVRQSPECMSAIIKHLRRYAVRLFLHPPLPETEQTRLTAFITHLGESLPLQTRRKLVRLLKMQLLWYSVQKSICNARKRTSRQLYCLLTRLFIDCLSS